MSRTRAGVSTFSFIRSSSVVPPATNLTSAPCCAVLACAAVATAVAESTGRMNSKVFIRSLAVALRILANLLDGRHDILIGAAAADVAAHQLLDGGVSGTARFPEQCNGRHDLARSAIPALVSIVSEERRLHGMQCVRRAQALNGCDFFPVVHQGQAKAGVHAPAIHMHRAGPALAMITTFLRAGEGNGLTDAIQQRRARIDAKMVVLAVNAQRDRDGALNVGPVRDCRKRATLCGATVRAHRCAPSND